MSPSEADLRAALREGEGDGFDPDDIISSVHHARARRRNVLLSAAAAVVVLGGTAAGITALVNGGNSPRTLAGANSPATPGAAGGSGNIKAVRPNHIGPNSANPSTAHAPKAPSNRRVGGTVGGSRMPGLIIPTCQPIRSLGGQNSPAPPSGSLISGPVKEFYMCPYSIAGAMPSGVPQPVVVSGPAARQLLHSLQNLPAKSHPRGCPMIASTRGTAIRIIPITPTGRHLPTITARVGQLACETMVTNGSAVRYGWQLPPRVAALLHLRPGPIRMTPLPNGPGHQPR